MTKRRDDQQVSVVGWFQPHVRPSWSGKIVDAITGEVKDDPLAVSMTKQSFKEECDINVIVRKFEATQDVNLLKMKQGSFQDLPSGLDLQGALDMINRSEEAFMALPAAIRAQFDNDPVLFVDAFNNPTPEFIRQLVGLGMATEHLPKKPDAPVSPSPLGGKGTEGEEGDSSNQK